MPRIRVCVDGKLYGYMTLSAENSISLQADSDMNAHVCFQGVPVEYLCSGKHDDIIEEVFDLDTFEPA